MLQITCPYCGPRDETEFSFGGQSHIARPDESVDDKTWGNYLFFRDNPNGIHYERWCDTQGCRQWFNVARSTVTHEIKAVYGMLDPKPEFES